MRTKTLLIAAAALAVGIGSSLAQTYSQNIVGYVNQVLPANAYSLLTASFATSDPTNNAEAVLPSLQTGDAILTWNAGSATYNVAVYIGPGTWLDGSGNPVNAPLLPPGKGFFYQTGAGVQETNTFVGTVVLTNSIGILANLYTLVGSTPPIAGSAESTNFSLPFQTGDEILAWNIGPSTYSVGVYVGPGSWIDGGTGDPVSAPNLSVGQGFFYQAGAGVPEVWHQNLIIQ